jgi:predicted HTH transcriptional regulator
MSQYKIDLKELSRRESEQVEWKKNGDYIHIAQGIAATLSAFANDINNLGGGYVVCGANEIKDIYGFPSVEYTGLTANKLAEIKGKVLTICNTNISPSVQPIVEEINHPTEADKRILVFIMPASTKAHSFKDGEKTTYWVRNAKSTIEAKNGLFQKLMIKNNEIDYFDKRINFHATEADIDLLAMRSYLSDMNLSLSNKSIEDFISDTAQITALIPPLFGKLGLDNTLRPRNFTILLFGKNPQRFFSHAHTIVSIYSGKDRGSVNAERYEFVGTIIEQAKEAIKILNNQSYVAFDKTDAHPNQVKYPIRALQEAVVNAIVHRDYQSPQPIRITVFSDRIEVLSPGNLHWGVSKENFLAGKASANWRNQSFAHLFYKLDLAQNEGQGISTIMRTMQEVGCPKPLFDIGDDNLTCILPAHPRHQLLRDLQQVQENLISGSYNNALSFLERKAAIKIASAKKCIITLNKPKASVVTKAKAKEKFKTLLDEAAIDLNKALVIAITEKEKEPFFKELQLLNILMDIEVN